MSEILYTARARVRKVEGLHRQGELETGDRLDYGVHGPIAEHFKIAVDRPYALPVDHIVAAAAG